MFRVNIRQPIFPVNDAPNNVKRRGALVEMSTQRHVALLKNVIQSVTLELTSGHCSLRSLLPRQLFGRLHFDIFTFFLRVRATSCLCKSYTTSSPFLFSRISYKSQWGHQAGTYPQVGAYPLSEPIAYPRSQQIGILRSRFWCDADTRSERVPPLSHVMFEQGPPLKRLACLQPFPLHRLPTVRCTHLT